MPSFHIFLVCTTLIVGGGWWGGGGVEQKLFFRSSCNRTFFCSRFCSSMNDARWVQNFIFLFLMSLKGKRRRGEFKIVLIASAKF